MTLRLWEQSADLRSCYWLVGHQGVQAARIQQPNSMLMAPAIPLFIDAPFKELRHVTPWLIPVSDDLVKLPNDILALGVTLECTVPTEILVNHLRSLLQAGLEGQSVLFRFYDPLVLTPMLNNITRMRQEQLLGPITRLAATTPQLSVALEKEAPESFVPHSEPWWVINPQDLVELYTPKQHAYALARRVWEILPQLVATLDQPEACIEQGLRLAPNALNEEERELWVLAHLAHASDPPLTELGQRLRLTQEQQQLALDWMETPRWQV